MKHWVLLFGLIIILLSSAVGCGQPGFTTYNNDMEGYNISYPLSWKVEASTDGTVYYIESPTRKASVKIVVAEAMSTRIAVNALLMSISRVTINNEVTLIEDKPAESPWDWYLSYDYETDFGIFHGEAYFKSTADHLYKLDTAGDKDKYDTYPFSAIISSFKLQ